MPKPPGGLLLRKTRLWKKRGKALKELLTSPRDYQWQRRAILFLRAKRNRRYFIEITGIRVERLQAISAADAKAEGCEGWHAQSPVKQFCTLWINLNGQDSWNANPWVWVYEFRKVKA